MCYCNNPGPSLHVVFEELHRKCKPCVKLNDPKLNKVLDLSIKHCFCLDGCYSSRIFTSIDEFTGAVTTPKQDWEKVVARYFDCPSEKGCDDCDCDKK